MEVGNSVLGVRKLVGSDPGGRVVRTFVTFPSNQVANLRLEAIVNSGIKDFRNLIFFLVIDLNRGRRFNLAIRNGARVMGLELGNMKDGMDAAHVRG
jgi:hypothetical protein